MNLTKINIFEVGPRDGFQNIKTFIPTEIKINIVKKLLEAGVTHMEATSFVSPKAIPQMKDAAEVMAAVHTLAPCAVLVPNMIGAQKAYEADAKTLIPVVSISETHNMKNVHCTVDESLEKIRAIHEFADEKGLNTRLNLATVFGCPYEGKISVKRIIEVMEKAYGFGVDHFTLCDTTGMANPIQTYDLIKDVQSALPVVHMGVHFHNTRGMAMANIFAAMELGIEDIECSVGGLGGCPFAKGASGNIATEDVVNILDDLGVTTGVNLDALLKVSAYIRDSLQMTMDSATLKAGPTFRPATAATCG